MNEVNLRIDANTPALKALRALLDVYEPDELLAALVIHAGVADLIATIATVVRRSTRPCGSWEAGILDDCVRRLEDWPMTTSVEKRFGP